VMMVVGILLCLALRETRAKHRHSLEQPVAKR
jgi:hypothetical protein